MELELTYDRNAKPGETVRYTPADPALAKIGSREHVLQVGQTADGFALVAATSICAALNAFLQGIGDSEAPVYEPRETYEPTPPEAALAKYQERATAAPRVMARWAAYNDRKLSSGEWPPDKFAVFMQKVGPVVVLLNSLAFGATAAAVQAFDDELATEEAKAAYLGMMAAEGALA